MREGERVERGEMEREREKSEGKYFLHSRRTFRERARQRNGQGVAGSCGRTRGVGERPFAAVIRLQRLSGEPRQQQQRQRQRQSWGPMWLIRWITSDVEAFLICKYFYSRRSHILQSQKNSLAAMENLARIISRHQNQSFWKSANEPSSNGRVSELCWVGGFHSQLIS